MAQERRKEGMGCPSEDSTSLVRTGRLEKVAKTRLEGFVVRIDSQTVPIIPFGALKLSETLVGQSSLQVCTRIAGILLELLGGELNLLLEGRFWLRSLLMPKRFG
jgi:hypothetical protein